MPNEITTQKELRRLFWDLHPDLDRRKIPYCPGSNRFRTRIYKCDTRCAFVDFVDSMHRNGTISDALADRVTL